MIGGTLTAVKKRIYESKKGRKALVGAFNSYTSSSLPDSDSVTDDKRP